MSEAPLAKTYDPEHVEQEHYRRWKDRGYFSPSGQTESPYCIVIPPPNVTGSLHMGHALNNTLQDVLIRFKRMQGHATLWQFGMDHAGIATQNVVERELTAENKTRFDVGRDAFVDRVWRWKEQYGGIIVQQLMKLGASCDWGRGRFTMDEGCSRAVREVFVSLYREGLIYRGNRLINWCPRCHTALSDLEVEHEDLQGHLYYITYPSPDGSKALTVATTRPETMLGDTAVAVNPNDSRHAGWAGNRVMLPLMNRPIPVIADEYVDVEFGTGALKITPAHDPNDFEIGARYKLDLVKVIGEDGTMTEEAGPYAGMDRFEARKRVVADLETLGLLVKTEPHAHSVGHCYRCKNIVEPSLSLQWFVNVRPLAEEAIAAVESGKIRIIPNSWEKTYYEWMRNIRDWCISRQIWWGHRIPAWYCDDCGEITVAAVDPEVCAHCGSASIVQDEDVLDTWFSSALWPFSTLGWPDETEELELFYPTSCLVTGFDILFFWVARMIMMGLKFRNEIPFKDVYIHALVRDAHGQKMSKSKGNVIDPIAVIDKFGTDSFRFTLASMAAQGRDISLSEERIEGYRHFVNKIWNASRFVLMNLDGYRSGNPERKELDVKDRWVISRMNTVVRTVTDAINDYRFNEAAHVLYQFVWHELCDWYLEMAKPALYGPKESPQRLCTQQVMTRVMKTAVELLHPIMPFVTEEIWQRLPETGESIVVASFPTECTKEYDVRAEEDMEVIIDTVSAIRNIRSEMNIPPSARPEADLVYHDTDAGCVLDDHAELISFLAGLKTTRVHSTLPRPKAAATAVVKNVDIFVLLEGIVDFGEEMKRVHKEMTKVNKDLAFVTKKLSNNDFLNRAPEEIVEKEREKMNILQEKIKKLDETYKRVKELCA